jgi:hypothetical protein
MTEPRDPDEIVDEDVEPPASDEDAERDTDPADED